MYGRGYSVLRLAAGDSTVRAQRLPTVLNQPEPIVLNQPACRLHHAH